jgi:hypothetical protein
MQALLDSSPLRERVEAAIRDIRLGHYERWLLREYVPMAGAATNFTLTLDTTAPAGVTISLNAGAAYTSTQAVTATIATSDSPTTGYQMKVYGDVDLSANANIQDTEANSTWITFSTSQAVTLLTGDGSKTVKVKVRDDVWNVSSEATDAITLDTTLPVPNITVGPDVTKVSKISGKRTCSFSWQANSAFDEYKIKTVPSSGSLESAGTTIATTNGSTNMAGSAGGYPATTNIDSTIDGRDLEVASSGDGAKTIKVFVKDAAANWSV